MTQLFGTDGVRGKAGDAPLDVPTVRRLGAALVRALRHDDAVARRSGAVRSFDSWPAATPASPAGGSSGSWPSASGARAEHSTSAGIIPTPAVAYLTPRMGYTAGVVISASHNPFEDNGIKVFSGAGEKFTEALERTGRGHRGRLVVDGGRRRGRAGRADRLSLRVHRPPPRDPAAPTRAPPACASPWTAPTARRRRWRRGCSRISGST